MDKITDWCQRYDALEEKLNTCPCNHKYTSFTINDESGEHVLYGELSAIYACLKKVFSDKKQKAPADLVNDVKNLINTLKDKEWANHLTKSELGRQLESEINELVNRVNQHNI